jgi:hypothetical protein
MISCTIVMVIFEVAPWDQLVQRLVDHLAKASVDPLG